MDQIQFWNRETQKLETERVYGDSAVKLVYQNPVGRLLTDWVFAKKPISQLYGWMQAHPMSAKKVEPFIKRFGIPMEDFEGAPFKSFNDFFVRKYKPGKRPFCTQPGDFSAPAEARYFAFDRLSRDSKLAVKGIELTPQGLLGSAKKAEPFEGGPGLLARLCPVDYHRYHYPDDGKTIDAYTIPGRFHSVNPIALEVQSDILVSNERRVAILETKNFGKVAYVEVGALFVGRIIQTHDESQSFSRGQEKGMFLFGASTVIILGEPGRWIPDADLLEQTKQGRESYVKIGTRVGRQKSNS
ncbi:MAG: phosphatidylserine decarboxylase [Bdellovibrionales bacterium]|nr:phosphatidylserine decarboxylase [Bdellovibrionales bacterium]